MIDRATELWSYKLFTTPGDVEVTVGKVVIVLAMLAASYYVSRFLGYLLGRRLAATKLSQDVAHTIQRVFFIATLVLVGMTTLNILGVPITAFAFATGAIAIGVGFGAQNMINNFISGWIMMAERPIRIDDFIEIEGAMGRVERIGTRSTRIRRVDGVHLLVPNSHLLERTVTNWTLVDEELRSSVRVGVAYGSPVRKVEELILKATREHPDVKETPDVLVFFDEFGDSALNFEVFFWSDASGEKELKRIRSDIRFEIDRLFAENDIVIAFPQQDVHLDSSDPIKVQVSHAND